MNNLKELVENCELIVEEMKKLDKNEREEAVGEIADSYNQISEMVKEIKPETLQYESLKIQCLETESESVSTVEEAKKFINILKVTDKEIGTTLTMSDTLFGFLFDFAGVLKELFKDDKDMEQYIINVDKQVAIIKKAMEG